MTVHIYGIKNCNSMKKAMNWLDEKGIEYKFHDYKKEEVDDILIQKALEQFGHDVVVNKKGTTWRKLDDDTKAKISNEKALELIKENASLAKRPMLINDGDIHIGFSEEEYEEIFK
ncbi:MAG: arsenate reductase [Rickettsiales bacterium]|nr:arsenate reductase [Rickettsiales bacterium]|tara:strand:- start:246 stop:593 length:348 start_codon:yes stop_codon:yes gene_type:complete